MTMIAVRTISSPSRRLPGRAPRLRHAEPARRALFLAGVLLASSPALAQRSEAQVEADIEFARGLAADWSFVDLAQRVLADTERAGVQGKQREELGLVTCEVFAVGARSERDDEKRNRLFLDSISAYKAFIEQNPYSEYKSEAEANLVATASQYSTSVDIALESVLGEEAESLKKSKVAVLEDAVRLTQDLIDGLLAVAEEERTQDQLRRLEALMLNRGLMLGNIGRSSKDGAYYFTQAIKALEEMFFAFGDGTPPALRAYKVIGDVRMWMGEPMEARYMYEGVVAQAWPMDKEAQDQLIEANGAPFTPGEMAVRYLFLELSTEGLLDSLLAVGEPQVACAYALHFYNTRQVFGLDWSVPAGYQSLLACARTLLDAGGYVGGDPTTGKTRWFETEDEMKAAFSSRREQRDAVTFALELADQVNRDNKGTILQVRAQKLLSDIVSRPGVQVSPEVLVEAAEGDYNNGDYGQAIDGMRRVLQRLEGLEQNERVRYGGRAMRYLGEALRQTDRDLEAAMAYREGLVTWSGDPEFDKQNADRYLAMMQLLVQKTPGDEVLSGLKREAEDFKTRYGAAGGEDQIWWNRGTQAYTDGDYREAAESFGKIAEDSDYFEKGQVKIQVCNFRAGAKAKDQGMIEAAVRGLDDYIERYVKSQVVESERRKAYRADALAEAEFFRGLGTNMAAGAGKDPALYRKVVEYLDGYAARYPNQDTLAPWTLEMLVDAHLVLGQIKEARRAVDEMLRDWKDNKRTAGVLKTYYKTLVTQREAATDPAKKTELLREMAGFLKIANDIGTPDFQAFRNEGKHWMELGEFEEALRINEKLLLAFGKDPANADNIKKYVLPDQGTILLEVGRVADAKSVLTPLVFGEGARPSKQTLLDWCRSVSGWLVGGQPGTPVQEVAGAGGSPEEWQEVINKLDAISQVGHKWQSCEWYEQRLMIVYAYYAWSAVDQRKLESGKQLMANMDIQLADPSYAEVEKFCTPGETEDEASVIERLGKGVLQARYQHMALKLR